MTDEAGQMGKTQDWARNKVSHRHLVPSLFPLSFSSSFSICQQAQFRMTLCPTVLCAIGLTSSCALTSPLMPATTYWVISPLIFLFFSLIWILFFSAFFFLCFFVATFLHCNFGNYCSFHSCISFSPSTTKDTALCGPDSKSSTTFIC